MPREVVILVVVSAFVVGPPCIAYVRFVVTGGIVRKSNYTEVDLMTISYFDLDQVNGRTQDIPAQFRALDGTRVQLTGEMWAPDSSAARIRSFDLVYSIGKCCFSGPPKIQHFVKATVKEGATTQFFGGAVNVTGILHVGVQHSSAGIESVYRIDVDRVDPL